MSLGKHRISVIAPPIAQKTNNTTSTCSFQSPCLPVGRKRGHSNNDCFQDPICGKCAGLHSTGSMLSTSDTYLCVNCGGHTSTDKVCPVRIEKLNKLKSSPRLPAYVASGNNVRYTREFIPAEAIRSNISYADMDGPRVLNLDRFRIIITRKNAQTTHHKT